MLSPSAGDMGQCASRVPPRVSEDCFLSAISSDLWSNDMRQPYSLLQTYGMDGWLSRSVDSSAASSLVSRVLSQVRSMSVNALRVQNLGWAEACAVETIKRQQPGSSFVFLATCRTSSQERQFSRGTGVVIHAPSFVGTTSTGPAPSAACWISWSCTRSSRPQFNAGNSAPSELVIEAVASQLALVASLH